MREWGEEGGCRGEERECGREELGGGEGMGRRLSWPIRIVGNEGPLKSVTAYPPSSTPTPHPPISHCPLVLSYNTVPTSYLLSPSLPLYSPSPSLLLFLTSLSLSLSTYSPSLFFPNPLSTLHSLSPFPSSLSTLPPFFFF